MVCKICNIEGCTNNMCLKSISDTKERIRKQNRKYYNRLKGYALCIECNTEIIAPKRLCEECRISRLKERRSQDIKRRREQRSCKAEGCIKPIINPTSNAVRYCSDECRPKKQVTSKKLADRKKSKEYKPKKEKKYEINPYFLTRGNISITGERMFGHGKSITRL